ncbi:hypothetical protein [Mastigocoleus testarum]|uniref:Uncharacterized protein n=1 Tax=Mastigocoleus testarum BC008 TaxID=371196 RepID=A0A0V7ZG76_9CYAN|nr:hypothetical protein [Mastigocoleus testarum]KST63496.1 hypothetical protein BC008_13615 [Mastigocoleus testarum BC008]
MSFVDRLKNNFEAYCLERKAKMVEGFEPRMLEELKLQLGSKEARMVSEDLKTSAAGLRHQAAITRNQGN